MFAGASLSADFNEKQSSHSACFDDYMARQDVNELLARLAELVGSLASWLKLLSSLPALTTKLAIPGLRGPVMMSTSGKGWSDQLAGEVLGAASTSPATLGKSSTRHNLSMYRGHALPSRLVSELKSGGLLSSSLSFVVPLVCKRITVLSALMRALEGRIDFSRPRAQRALADLLTSMLEEAASAEVRASQDQSDFPHCFLARAMGRVSSMRDQQHEELLLGSSEPGASRLVDTLILSRLAWSPVQEMCLALRVVRHSVVFTRLRSCINSCWNCVLAMRQRPVSDQCRFTCLPNLTALAEQFSELLFWSWSQS